MLLDTFKPLELLCTLLTVLGYLLDHGEQTLGVIEASQGLLVQTTFRTARSRIRNFSGL